MTDASELTQTFGSSDPIFRKFAGEYRTIEAQLALKKAFDNRARDLTAKHFLQTPEQVKHLKTSLAAPQFGRTKLAELFGMLASCIDETDTELYVTSQLTHILQVAEGMERAGIKDETMLLAGIVHDIGKVALLSGIPPELVNCPNEPVGTENKPGAGLDNTLLTWNHDEFAYQRIGAHLPDHVAWLVRYHSLRFDKAAQFMDDRDREYHNKYLGTFRQFDLGTKSVFSAPKSNISRYLPLVEKYLSPEVVI